MSHMSAPPETKKPRLCVDIDNVLAQTDQVMRRVISNYTQGRVNYEYDHITEFDYHKCVDAAGNSSTREDWRGIHSLFAESHHILAIEPMPNAVEQLNRLSERFDIHIATTRLPQARRSMIEWLERHGFPPFDLHFLKHGEKHAWFMPFFAAVEDDYGQAVAFVESGSPAFLLEHPWNRTKPRRENLEWVADWLSLAERLEALLGSA